MSLEELVQCDSPLHTCDGSYDAMAANRITCAYILSPSMSYETIAMGPLLTTEIYTRDERNVGALRNFQRVDPDSNLSPLRRILNNSHIIIRCNIHAPERPNTPISSLLRHRCLVGKDGEILDDETTNIDRRFA